MNHSKAKTAVSTLGVAAASLLAVLPATGCMVRAEYEENPEQGGGGGGFPDDPYPGSEGGEPCGMGINNEVFSDGSCVCLPGFEWCDPADETSLDCCTPGIADDCGEGSNNVAQSDGSCACLPGFDWCNMDDESDLNCCEDSVESCGEGSNNQLTPAGECQCLPGFDWCDQDDETSLFCCDVDGGDDSGGDGDDDGETSGDDSGDTGDDEGYGCEGEMEVTQLAIYEDTVWKAGATCIVDGRVTVHAGATLTIEDGVQVKFKRSAGSGHGIFVEGRLEVGGSSTAPVVMTDFADDSAGGDSNADGGTPVPALGTDSWVGLRFSQGSQGLIHELETRYVFGDAVIGIDRADPVIENLTARNVGAPTITMGASDMPQIAGITTINGLRDGITVQGGTVQGNVTWDADTPYTLAGTVRVSAGSELGIAAGVVVKFDTMQFEADAVGLEVDGRLLVSGTATQPVVLTESRDDSAGGDTNQDGSASVPLAEPGSWAGISVSSTGRAEIQYATLRYSHGAGAIVNEGQTVVNDSVIRDNRVGLFGEAPGLMTVRNSGIFDNAFAGAMALGPNAIDAINNWWGATSGPGGEGHGEGNPITAGVSFEPVLTTPVQ